MPTKPDRANVTLDRTLHKPLKFLALAEDSTLEQMLDQAVTQLLARTAPGFVPPAPGIAPAATGIPKPSAEIARIPRPKTGPRPELPAQNAEKPEEIGAKRGSAQDLPPQPRQNHAAPPVMLEPAEMTFDPNRPKNRGRQRRGGVSPMLVNLVTHANKGPTDAERKRGIIGTVTIDGDI